MSDHPQKFKLGAANYLPLLLGGCALLASLIYELQRAGLVRPRSFERFVQYHLDAIGVTAFGLAITGVTVGLWLGRAGRRNRPLLWGIVVSVIAAVAQLLLPL